MMNTEYLQRVVDVLETMIPEDKFHMNQWLHDEKLQGYHIHVFKWKATLDDLSNKCKTMACAAGWATLVIPELSIVSNNVVYTENKGNVYGLRGL